MRLHSGDRLLGAALIAFAIGLLATAAMFAVPAIDDGHRASIWVYALTLGLPIGFVLALVFALRSGRRHRQAGPSDAGPQNGTAS